jgi:hypothetical protein
MRVYRVCPKSGGRQRPIKDIDGCYVLGAPHHGQEKHHAKNKTRVRSEEEMIALLRKGYSVRVGNPTGARLVRRNLFVDGSPLP